MRKPRELSKSALRHLLWRCVEKYREQLAAVGFTHVNGRERWRFFKYARTRLHLAEATVQDAYDFLNDTTEEHEAR